MYAFLSGLLFSSEADKVDTIPSSCRIDDSPGALLRAHVLDVAVVRGCADCLPKGHGVLVDGSSATVLLVVLETFEGEKVVATVIFFFFLNLRAYVIGLRSK